VTITAPDHLVSGLLHGGQMHWYRIDERGGYKIQLTHGMPRVHLDVYTADNLSVPVKPFSTLDDPATHDQTGDTRFALPTAPFYLRVSLPERRGEAQYGDAEFELVELDDFSPVDRAAVMISQFDTLANDQRLLEGNVSGALIKVTAIFDPADDDDDDDDGICDLTITVSPEPPRQM
jgi:hypothetical protein